MLMRRAAAGGPGAGRLAQLWTAGWPGVQPQTKVA